LEIPKEFFEYMGDTQISRLDGKELRASLSEPKCEFFIREK
jgi:hypothetical protein